ncbi:MAG: PAS domain S-box protein [Ignavibacteriaceae bacterium]
MKASIRILVVEDSTLISLDIQRALKFLGYNVAGTASTGDDAIKAVEELKPDLILMDIRLKGEMDGIEATRTIKTKYDVPVVYLTAYADEQTLERAKLTEPLGYLLKPFEERELNSVLQMALYKHSLDRKLKENEKWLSTTMKSIGDGVIATDNAGKIKFMNPVAEELTGYKQEEAEGKKLTEVFVISNEDSKIPVENPVNKVLMHGKTVGLANHTILTDKSGKVRFINDTASPILDEEGEITGVVLVFQDVTTKKIAEIALREQEESYRSLVESSIDAIYVLKGKRLLLVNKAWEELFGISKEEATSDNFDIMEIVAEESMNFILEKFNKNSPAAESSRYEMKAVSRNGNTIDLEVSVSRIWWKGEYAYQGVYRDITLRKMEEERLKYAIELAERSNRLKNEFLAHMSHEIRTPLNNILTFTSLLKEELEDKLPAELESTFSIISNSAQRLIRTIESLLNLSRLQTGNYDAKYEAIDLHRDVLEDLTLEFYLRASEKKIEIIYQNNSENSFVSGDSYSITQIFVNLIDNAIKYTPSGSVIIRLYNEDNSVIVEIEDSGIGISDEFLPNLFSPFTQEDSGNTRPYEGTGLGLALVKNYVDINNGSIGVESKKGSGTKFRIVFTSLSEQV